MSNRFGAAEADCDATIALDPTYVKAFQRRAVARMALKKYSLAKDDLLAVLRLEPKNKEAKNELTKAEEVTDFCYLFIRLALRDSW